MKRIFFSLVFSIAVLVLCPAQIKICGIKGAVSVPFTYLVSDTEKYSFTTADSAEEAVKSMSYGDADCTIISYEAAEKLVSASNGKVTAAAEVSGTDFSVVASKKGIKSLSDLLGKKVYVQGNSREEKIFRWVLKKYEIPCGASDGCVQIKTDCSSDQLVSMLLSGKIQYAVLSGSEKAAAIKRSFSTYEAVNLQKEIQAATGAVPEEPLTVCVIRTQLLKENPEQVKIFLEDLENSINRVKSSPSRAAQLNSEYKMGLNPSFATYTISSLNLGFRSLIAK